MLSVSPVERFGGKAETDLKSKTDVDCSVVSTTCEMWIDPEWRRVDLGFDPHYGSRSQNNHRVAGKRSNNHVRVAVVVDVGRAGRQRSTESPQTGDAGEFPGADALRVRR